MWALSVSHRNVNWYAPRAFSALLRGAPGLLLQPLPPVSFRSHEDTQTQAPATPFQRTWRVGSFAKKSKGWPDHSQSKVGQIQSCRCFCTRIHCNDPLVLMSLSLCLGDTESVQRNETPRAFNTTLSQSSRDMNFGNRSSETVANYVARASVTTDKLCKFAAETTADHKLSLGLVSKAFPSRTRNLQEDR